MKVTYVFALLAATLVSASPAPGSSDELALRDLTREECKERCSKGVNDMSDYCDDIKYKGPRRICEYIAERLSEDQVQEHCVEFCDDWL